MDRSRKLRSIDVAFMTYNIQQNLTKAMLIDYRHATFFGEYDWVDSCVIIFRQHDF